MIFSSLVFLFRFFPIVFLIYYVVPKKIKNVVLFISSLIFYSWGEPRFFPIMMTSIIINYIAGLLIQKFEQKENLRKVCLYGSLVFTFGFLFFFKYTNFFIRNINALGADISEIQALTLPLGISFYTFQIAAYTIDVYRRKVEAEHNFIDFGAFVALFPQLIAGPIVLYSDINCELKNRKIDLAEIEDGIRLFIMGIGSKVLLADNISLLWQEVQTLGFKNVSSILVWMGVIAYTFQIYFDFSGYSLMAIGLGKMLGFKFPQNFNYPYISKSVTEFWRRWHITLSSWFKEYVYIPLGGNRVSKSRHYLNLFIVWFLTGFWHGANWNFIIWGLYFFVFLMIEKVFLLPYLEKSKVWSHIYLMFLVIISWAIFGISDMGQLGLLLKSMFSFTGGYDWLYYLGNYGAIFILCLVCSTPLLKKCYEKWGHIKLLKIGFISVVFLLSLAYMVDSTYSPFLYFNF